LDIETFQITLSILEVGTGVDGTGVANKTFQVEKSVQEEFSCT
jgi:hypothetical protein